tara:strand:+ start:2354 stop:2545 length:192 start_codon:yes stop_codon:yes gene_type:complete
MAFTKSADGIAKKGRTDGKNLGDSGPTKGATMGGKGKHGGGIRNIDMKTMGRGMAKVAAQKRG